MRRWAKEIECARVFAPFVNVYLLISSAFPNTIMPFAIAAHSDSMPKNQKEEEKKTKTKTKKKNDVNERTGEGIR